MPRNNPFNARGKFFGDSARLKTWEGGFHTALDREFTVAYAQHKWSTSPFNGMLVGIRGKPGPLGDPGETVVADYPVVLTLNMAGFRRFADIDARRAVQEVMSVAHSNGVRGEGPGAAHEFMDLLDHFFDEEDYETRHHYGDDALMTLFALASASSQKTAIRVTRDYMQDIGRYADEEAATAERTEAYENLRRIAALLGRGRDERGYGTDNENRMLSEADDNLLIDVYRQAVYWNDIPNARLLSVQYMHPFYDKVVEEDPSTDDHGDSDEGISSAAWLEARAEEGYTLLNDNDDNVPAEFETAWQVKHGDVPLLDHAGLAPGAWDDGPMSRANRGLVDSRIEYHGTSLSNLLSACPHLYDVLPEPPVPFSSTIERLMDAIEARTPKEAKADEADAEAQLGLLLKHG